MYKLHAGGITRQNRKMCPIEDVYKNKQYVVEGQYRKRLT